MGSSYTIVVDSTVDIPAKLADELKIIVIPYIFMLDGEEYYNHLDYRDLPIKDFYDALRNGMTATTTQVTAYRYMETWEPFLQDGKDILYMCLSSGLSRSYDQSMIAAREAMEAYPGRKVITIDSRSASLGQGALAYYAAKARDEGKTLEENASYIKELIPRLHHWIAPDDLNHLRRGGRVSATSAFVGNMLNIKPIITISTDGKMLPVSKVRGAGKVIEHILGRMTEFEMSPADQTVFIAHSDSHDAAKRLANAINAKFGIKEFITGEIGPVIGAHTGPGTVAAVFLGNKRVRSMDE